MTMADFCFKQEHGWISYQILPGNFIVVCSGSPYHYLKVVQTISSNVKFSED